MANYQRPSFIKKGIDFSIIYFPETRKFLIAKGVLEDFFQDSFDLRQGDYNSLVENIISKHPEFKACFIISKSTTFENFDENDLSITTTILSSRLLLSNHVVEVRFDINSIKDIFLSAYAHLTTSENLTSIHNVLSIVHDESKLYLFSDSKIKSVSLKKEYFKIQAQFAYTLIEYYHNLESNQWLCSFHACAVQKKNKTYLILGDSGAGKSTLTALMCANGYRFIGDDLILMDKAIHIYDNPAALSVKENSWRIVSKYYEEISAISPSNRTKGNIKMKYLPLHLIQDNKPKKHKISALIWVNYKPNSKTQITPLSSIDICSKLIPDTWVNPESNYPELFAQWLIQTNGYQTTYSDYSSLKNILDEYL
ncbi:MAG: hypothetical protein ACPF88_05265 [Flavobacteriaceae bacterium]